MGFWQRITDGSSGKTGSSYGRGGRGRKNLMAPSSDRPASRALAEERERGAVKRTMDEEHFASGMPTGHMSMSDKLDSHRQGNLFKYAVITNAPSDERSGFLSKLRSFSPPTKVENLTLSDLPAIRLVGDTVTFPLKTVLPSKLLSGSSSYLFIDCILVQFIPLDSFANDKSVVTVQVNDFRKTTNTVARSAKMDNTMGYNLLFSLDYCIETRDVDKMNLSFTCPLKNFQEGVAWGAVKVVAQLQFLTFPKRFPLVETMGAALFSDTDLDQFQCDPREIDLVLTPGALGGLRDANVRGEIENLTIPKTDKTELVTAKTILGGGLDENPVDDVMDKMKAIALVKERQKAAALTNSQRLIAISSEAEANLEDKGTSTTVNSPQSQPASECGDMKGWDADGPDIDDSISRFSNSPGELQPEDVPKRETRVVRMAG